ncbi:FAD-binding domain-containing protein [Nocardioides sp.]|uniref:FAD-binding domain-containing protein n=1 Tax=Nocardioides sp. TaxID=35761 RepID=UPI00351286F3
MSVLPSPPAPSEGATPADVVAWVATHLGHLAREGADGVRAGAIRGGQSAADAALAGLDVRGYARDRSTVLPEHRQGATRMSPYVRHGLVTLRELWDAVTDAPPRDRDKYRDELLWQEYARHLYARVGRDSARPYRAEQPRVAQPWSNPWDRSLPCLEEAVGRQLVRDGWVVNQSRMWLASQWAVRGGVDWRAGEDAMFAHLLDGSRAANRLGWQWTVGTGNAKPYGFSRWQVEKRSPQLCRSCPLAARCPIEDFPDTPPGPPVQGPDLGRGPIPAGPERVSGGGADAVWLTAESLGAGDPALAADPDRPAVFVLDAPLLARLRLSGKRLVFLAETLGDLAAHRHLEVRLGAVPEELAGRRVAVTHAPVPGFARLRRRVDVVEEHPYPWLVVPRPAPLRSFSAWRQGARPR